MRALKPENCGASNPAKSIAIIAKAIGRSVKHKQLKDISTGNSVEMSSEILACLVNMSWKE